MFTSLELRTFVVTWIKTALPGVSIIRADENKARPTLPYLTYKIGTRTPQGQFQRSGADASGNEKVKSHKDVVVTINGYGDDSEDLLLNLEMSLGLDSIIGLFKINNVANRGIAISVTEIPALLDATIEQRFLYEPVFGYAEEKVEDVSYIGTVESVRDNSTILPPSGT